ncbi:MAG: zinc ribbon domain-containing protein, partial [Candidatus Thorarchaeota archaeon]
EYFYCPHCEAELHADVNAARNIIYVPSAVAGRTRT